ncbi:MAG: 1-acyl-sn-glycerol-3-phosphate acyltransferase [Oscillospiraceae bacterium]|nr:1-acyl-sn-glycerol-3-phosphate acyltransferase [Oscillospiraceae bacterium]
MLIGGITALSTVLAVVICLCCGCFGSLTWLWVLPLGFAGSFLVLGVLAFLFFYAMCAIVRQDKEQDKDSPFYRWIAGLLTEAAMTILQMRVHTRGLENTPKEGRFLLVCNHLNDLDPVTLLEFFKKSQLAFISKRENSTMFMVGNLMHKLQCQLINRENDREALKTILKCIQILKEDKASIAVFPEGYTSRDHKFHHFRSGVFKIAQKAKVPIVVCTITNTHKVFHNALRLKPTDVDLHLLAVIRPEEFAGMTTVELGERIYAMMLEDLGPEYAEENT